MIRIYSNESLIQVHHVKNILESNQIICQIKNDNLTSLAGEVPSFECWPEIWIQEESSTQALKIIETDKQHSLIIKADWQCHNCKEEVEGEFEICWQCGTLKP